MDFSLKGHCYRSRMYLTHSHVGSEKALNASESWTFIRQMKASGENGKGGDWRGSSSW